MQFAQSIVYVVISQNKAFIYTSQYTHFCQDNANSKMFVWKIVLLIYNIICA